MVDVELLSKLSNPDLDVEKLVAVKLATLSNLQPDLVEKEANRRINRLKSRLGIKNGEGVYIHTILH